MSACGNKMGRSGRTCHLPSGHAGDHEGYRPGSGVLAHWSDGWEPGVPGIQGIPGLPDSLFSPDKRAELPPQELQ